MQSKKGPRTGISDDSSIVNLYIQQKKRKKDYSQYEGEKNEVQFTSTNCQEASRFSEHKAPKKF